MEDEDLPTVYEAKPGDDAWGMRVGANHTVRWDGEGSPYVRCLAGRAYLTDDMDHVAYVKE